MLILVSVSVAEGEGGLSVSPIVTIVTKNKVRSLFPGGADG